MRARGETPSPCGPRSVCQYSRSVISNRPTVTLRKARPEDASQVAEIWRLGWQDGHLGFVPQELVDVRTEDSFRARASARVGDTTVAIVDGAVAGFVMVVDDEVEQVYVSAAHRGAGVADVLMRDGRAASQSERAQQGVARSGRRQRTSPGFLRSNRVARRGTVRLRRRRRGRTDRGALLSLYEARVERRSDPVSRISSSTARSSDPPEQRAP